MTQSQGTIKSLPNMGDREESLKLGAHFQLAGSSAGWRMSSLGRLISFKSLPGSLAGLYLWEVFTIYLHLGREEPSISF